jgi:hypothetical protein
MSQPDLNHLLSILEQKKEWLTEMREITIKCGTMLENDDVDAFSESLEAREGIINKIDAFSKIEKQIPNVADKQVDVLKHEIRGIILKIIELDERNTSLAQSKIDLYKAQLKDLNQKQKGIGKYKNAYQKNDAFYFDEKK